MEGEKPATKRWVLKDLKLSAALSEPFQTHGVEEVKIVTPDSGDSLIISEKVLYWFKGDILCRKLVYSSKILNSFFTNFKNDTNKRALVVLLADAANFYYENGKSYMISFPFKVLAGLPCLNGMILQRDETRSTNIFFFTILEPMAEFGTVVSSATSNISSDEKLIYFPGCKTSKISLTYNHVEKELSFYHTRFVNRQNEDKPIKDHLHNQKEPLKRRKASRKAAATIEFINQEDRMAVNGESLIKVDKSRASFSETLSIDRMASYDPFNSNKNNNNINNNAKISESASNLNSSSSSFDPTVLRKDYILDRIFTAPCGHLQDYKVLSLPFGDSREGIIIRAKGFVKVFIFDCTNISFSPKLLKSIDLSHNYQDLAILEDLPGFIILVEKNSCDLTIYNPFLSIELTVLQSYTQIKEIFSTYNSYVVFRNFDDEVATLQLNLKPSSSIVSSLIESLKYLTNSYSFNYIKIIWIYSYIILKKDWESFLLTIVALILPNPVEEKHLDDSNIILQVLRKIGPIQQKLREDQFSLYQLSPNIVLALHLICEDMKLNVLNKKCMNDIRVLIQQLIVWIGWNDSWVSYYSTNDNHVKFNDLLKFPVPQLLQKPPDIFKSLNSLFEQEIIPYLTFSQLVQESEFIDEKITPRSFYVLRLFEAIISPDFSPVDVTNMMVEFNITLSDLETYPVGIFIPLKESIVFCQQKIESVESLLDSKLYQLIGRKDLAEFVKEKRRNGIEGRSTGAFLSSNQYGQSKDIHQVVSSINEFQEPIAPLEYDRFQLTKLIFNEDRRFYEISKMLQTFKTQIVFSNSISELTEADSLLKRRQLAALVSLRTLTIPLGRSIMLYSSKEPLVTEKFPIPKLNFSIQIQPENIGVSFEKESIHENTLNWGEFHNGAAAALTISRDFKGISGSWIVFNRPAQLSPQHGGFILGLGLNGHMKNLEEWNIYNYLGPKHVFTSIGLLLGMSASLRGTMDVKLTKVLSVHIVALLPHGASDLIVSPQVQTAGLIGIGLLYLETQHRRMSEILLSQVNGTICVEEKQVADESYRVSAGVSLGYINLGKGDDLKGMNDTHVVDKLLAIAATMKDVQTNESFDKSMNAALMALMFIYMKTNDESTAKKIQLPGTDQLLDYFRPDVLLLRVLAKNVIMWDSIENSLEWVESQIPENLSNKDRIININFHNIVAGICLSIALKFSSTGDLKARDTVLSFYDKVDSLMTVYHSDDNFDSRVLHHSLSSVRVILGICLSLIMASTGDLETFKRLRALHGNFEDKNETNTMLYGEFMGINMALGFLFLAGGQFAIMKDSNFAVAALITSIYPIFPRTSISSHQSDVHLQALRHFWCLAVQPRCLVIRDVTTKKPLTTMVNLVLKNGETKNVTCPSLLPDLTSIKEIKLFESNEYFKSKITNLENLVKNGLNVYVYKKGEQKPIQKAIELMLDKVNNSFNDSDPEGSALLKLNIFKGFIEDELQGSLNAGTGNETSGKEFAVDSLHSNIIDKQIEINELVRNIKTVDDLWNMKLVFAYYDKMLSEDDIYYLNSEYIENLKIKLWRVMKG